MPTLLKLAGQESNSQFLNTEVKGSIRIFALDIFFRCQDGKDGKHFLRRGNISEHLHILSPNLSNKTQKVRYS